MTIVNHTTLLNCVYKSNYPVSLGTFCILTNGFHVQQNVNTCYTIVTNMYIQYSDPSPSMMCTLKIILPQNFQWEC